MRKLNIVLVAGLVFLREILVVKTAFAPPQTIAHHTLRTNVRIAINEIVTDPQQDWNDSAGGNGIPFDGQPGNGSITATDEWVELYNNGIDAVDLLSASGWKLLLVDTTPDTLFFADPGSTVEFVFSNGGSLGNFQPDEYLVIGNPPGNLNNDIYLVLEDGLGALVDDVELGDDPEGDGGGDGAPDGGPGGGNATGIDDEAIARVPNGIDSDDDVADFSQQAATIGFSNDTTDCISDGDINNDGNLTPGDALCAFKTFLNGQEVPADCDIADWDCEVIAGDVNCDGTVTPGDALAIFQRFLDGDPPLECFVFAARL